MKSLVAKFFLSLCLSVAGFCLRPMCFKSDERPAAQVTTDRATLII
jgi:hypothetical protein